MKPADHSLRVRVELLALVGASILTVILFTTQSQWAWLALGALGAYLVMASLANRHWGKQFRVLAGVAGIGLLTGCILPWLDLAFGTTQLGLG